MLGDECEILETLDDEKSDGGYVDYVLRMSYKYHGVLLYEFCVRCNVVTTKLLNIESLLAMKCIEWMVSWQCRQTYVETKTVFGGGMFCQLFLLGAIHGVQTVA